MSATNLKQVFAAAIIAVAGTASTAYAATVDTVLSLVIDVSGSISTAEYNLQMDGYANAFRDATIQAGILDTGNGDLGAIAVNVVQFSTSAVQTLAFQVLNSVGAINTFADTLDTMARSSNGSTNVGAGIQLGASSIANWLLAGNAATRRVIDVSGDGTQNSTPPVASTASAAACAAGNVVNGITIGGGASLQTWYTNNVQCGTGSFTLSANSFEDFDNAIKTKLKAEITGEPPTIPLPASAVLLLAGLGGFAAFKRGGSKKS